LDLGENLFWNDINYSTYWYYVEDYEMVRKYCLKIIKEIKINYFKSFAFNQLSIIEEKDNFEKSLVYFYLAVKQIVHMKKNKLKHNRISYFKKSYEQLIDKMHEVVLLDHSSRIHRLQVRFQELLSKVTD
jgi:hypothetical protein